MILEGVRGSGGAPGSAGTLGGSAGGGERGGEVSGVREGWAGEQGGGERASNWLSLHVHITYTCAAA